MPNKLTTMKLILSCALLSMSDLTQAETKSPPKFSEYCEDIPIGASIKVDVSTHKSKSKVEQKYTLKRSALGKYEVYFNLNFKVLKELKQKNLRESKNDSDSITQMRSDISQCFENFEPYLKDERGIQIKFILFDPKLHTDIATPPQVNVTINVDKGFFSRANSRNYLEGQDCSTTVHEFGHLVGLVDEYQENGLYANRDIIGYLFKSTLSTQEAYSKGEKEFDKYLEQGAIYDCRAIGPENTLMATPSLLFEYLRANKKQTPQNIFFSGHLNEIIYPNCSIKNKKYFSCAKFKFSTSRHNNGAGLSFSDCKNQIPEECKNVDWVKVDP